MQTRQTRGGESGFAPVYDAHSRVLILGSYPSPKSFETGFYYGHPQNRFWPLLAQLCGKECPTNRAQKESLLLSQNIALWDVLETCTITGASDSSIRNPKPNPLFEVFQNLPIEAVFCNGATAHRLYQRHCEADFKHTALRLPSTSAANAACNLACLLLQWSALCAYLPSAPTQ